MEITTRMSEEESKVSEKAAAETEASKTEQTADVKDEDKNEKAEDKSIALAGAKYEYDELKQRVDEIAKSADSETGLLNAAESYTMFAILERHPACDEKMAGGVKALGFGVNPEFPDTKAFFVLHNDDTKSYWSSRKGMEACYDFKASLIRKRPAGADWSQGDSKMHDGQPNFTRGCILSITGVAGMEYPALKEVLAAKGNVRFVEIEGDAARARFATPEDARKALEVKEVDSKPLELTILEGDAEISVWRKLQAGKKGRKGGKGGKKGGKGRK